MLNRCRKYARSLAIAVGVWLCAACAPLWAAAATTTVLTVPPSPVKWRNPVTLKAAVNSGGLSVAPGLVKFCNATAASCSGTAVLGQAQLTTTGIATLKVALSIGTHSIKALFAGTNAHESSISAAETVTVTGTYPSTTGISSSSASPYSLTATITGNAAQPLSGSVSFVDSSNGSYLLGSAKLGATKAGLSFTAQTLGVTGSEPMPMAAGDFNGDGIPDLVVGNLSAPDGVYTMSVFLSTGAGTYAAPEPIELPSTFLDAAGIVVGDFNNDGCLDLAVAGDNSGSVIIFLGNCQGGFTPGSPISIGGTSTPNSMAVGDFNNDGNLDLAVTSRTFATVTILLGNGDGTFTTVATSPSTGTWPYSVAVGDFNNDGKQDLVIANYFGSDVTVLLGNGDGTFTATASSPNAGTYPDAVAVGDFNGDGKQDLAVVNQFSKDLTILLGDGKGGFTAAAESPATGNNPDSIAMGDFNGDGIEDLAVANSSDSSVTVMLGKGDGTFSTVQTVPLSAGTEPSSVQAADFNADGRLDFAVAGSGDNTAVVTLNTATTTASATISGVTIPGGGMHNTGASYSGNANYASSASGTIRLTGTPIRTTVALAIEPAGTVAVGETVQLTATISPALVGGLTPSGTASFYNGTTLLASVPVVNTVAVYNDKAISAGTESMSVKYSGDLNFTASTSSAVSVTVVSPAASTTALKASSNSVANGMIVTLTAKVTSGGGSAVRRGVVAFCNAAFRFCEDLGKLGSAQLTSSGTAAIKLALPVGANSIFASFQGTAEMLGSKSSTQAVTVTGRLATSTTLAVNGTPGNYTFTAMVTGRGPKVKGSINFSDISDNNLSLGTLALAPDAINSFVPSPLVNIGGFPEDVIATDLNGDGDLDVVATNWTSAISVLLGNGHGGLSVKQTIPVASSVSLALGDFNNDGRPDIASVNQSTSKLDIFLGNGDGTLSLKTSVPVSDPFGVTVADFNRDGIADIAVGNGESGTISVLMGNGDGTFTADPVSPQVSNPGALASADFNGDGNPDLAVVSENGAVYILLGNGDGTFQQPSSIGVGVDPGNIKVGDFNGDGIPDLVVVNVVSGTLSVLLGKGDGTFQSFVVNTPYENAGAIAVGDLNGDGKSDMVLSDALGSPSTIYISNGNGTFATQTLTGPLSNAGGIAVGDFDNDGFPDIAFSQHTAANVGVLLSKAVSTATLAGVAVPGTGTQNIEAIYTGTAPYSSSTSPAVPVTGTGAKP